MENLLRLLHPGYLHALAHPHHRRRHYALLQVQQRLWPLSHQHLLRLQVDHERRHHDDLQPLGHVSRSHAAVCLLRIVLRLRRH